jgi:hypothetical protein
MLSEKAFKGKAGEIRGLLGFVVSMIKKYRQALITENPDPECAKSFLFMEAAMDAATGFCFKANSLCL